MALLVAGVALLACVTGLHNQFTQDDLPLIAQNLRIHDLGNWREIVTSPFWPPPYSEDLYRPVTALLLAFQWTLAKGGPLLFRIVSDLLYAGASLAVLGLARRLVPLGVAVLVALLFAAHPVHVEAVALGAGQSELLVSICVVAALARYLRRRREGGLGAGDWILLGGLYLAACLSKEHALLLPGLLLAAEVLLLRGPFRERARALLPGYLFLLALGGLVLLARAAVLPGNLAGTFTADALVGVSLPRRALTMLRIVPQWTRLLLWPAHLQADYSPQEIVASTGFGGAEALGALLLGGALLAVWLTRKRAPTIAFGLCWMAIALFPVSNLLVPTGIVLAERTLLLPSVGLLLALGGVLSVLWQPRAARTPIVIATAVTLLLVVAGVARSAERQTVWHDETTFRIRSVADAPLSWRAQLSYGTSLLEQGAEEPGLAAYQRALELAPPELRWRVRNDLAQRYFASGDDQRAVGVLLASREGNPEVEETWHYLVLGWLTLGNYPVAGAEADSALARGFSQQLFGDLRALADSAAHNHVPPGGIRIRVNR